MTEEVWEKLEQDRRVMVEKYNQEITMMRSKIVDLQKYCQILELHLRQGSLGFAPSSMTIKNTRISLEEENVLGEQLSYHKEKNK